MISHGYSVKEHDDPIVNIVEDAAAQFSECLEPGAFLVDVIPFRRSRFSYLLCRTITDMIIHRPGNLSTTLSLRLTGASP